MRRYFALILLLASLFSVEQLEARRKENLSCIDSLIMHEERFDSLTDARNARFFDSLRIKASRSKVGKLLYDLLVTAPQTIQNSPTGAVVDESRRFRPYTGRAIRSINIQVMEPFDTLGNWFERAGNTLHVKTRTGIIRQDLLFDEGDPVDPQQMVRQLQLLRSRRYISDADVIIRRIPGNFRQVDIYVLVYDSWTISVDGSLGSGGETMVGLSDANIAGLGAQFGVDVNFNRRDFSFGGTIFKIDAPNLFGSFYHGSLSVGREFSESELKFSLEKPLIQPTDYSVGFSYTRIKEDKEFVAPDTALFFSRTFNTDLWAGFSHKFAPTPFNIFLMAHYNRLRYGERPTVEARLNPYYHENDNVLFSTGIYYEKFYTTNMLYGYGTREYIPTGYRCELIGGYTWGEFRNDYYMGACVSAGDFYRPGFFFASLGVASYIGRHTHDWYQSMAQVNLRWFSNLHSFRRNHLRQFISMNYTVGWNRTNGYEEQIKFDNYGNIRMLNEDIDGLTRLSFNAESIVFTRFQPLGFRMTFFGYFDFGTLGYSYNPFKNGFYSTIGAGLRFKNERLIFSAIQIQFGICLGKGGLLHSDWIEISGQAGLPDYRYMPKRPDRLEYK